MPTQSRQVAAFARSNNLRAIAQLAVNNPRLADEIAVAAAALLTPEKAVQLAGAIAEVLPDSGAQVAKVVAEAHPESAALVVAVVIQTVGGSAPNPNRSGGRCRSFASGPRDGHRYCSLSGGDYPSYWRRRGGHRFYL